METILVLFFMGLIVLLSFLKTKLSERWQLIATLSAGLLLLTWIWGFEDGERHWKILITVVVIGSIYNLIRKLRTSTRISDNAVS